MRETQWEPEYKFWPFPVLKAESDWDRSDWDHINFLRAAYAEGYRPYQGPCSTVGAGSPSERGVFLIWRGRRNGWEVRLNEGERDFRLGPFYGLPLGDCACVCVRPPFGGAAHLALEWLRGRSLESLLEDFTFIGGNPSGIELRPEAVDDGLASNASDSISGGRSTGCAARPQFLLPRKRRKPPRG